jgi:general secretion pathway protein L
MTLRVQMIEAFWRWMELVASGIIAVGASLGSKRRVQVIEGDGKGFTLRVIDASKHHHLADQRLCLTDEAVTLPADWLATLRGSDVELVLKPTRFLFRRVELPRRATEFLDGIIRSQIDRLTPWGPDDVIYHWTEPVEAANQHIVVNVTATARVMVAPFVEALEKLGAANIAISTTASDLIDSSVAIKVFEQRGRGAIEMRRLTQALAAALIVVGTVAGLSVSTSAVVVGHFENSQQDLTRRIAQRRAAMRLGREADGPSQTILEQRKHASPSSVIAIEALSRLLPDHTFITELRIDGDRLQIIGITRDAPSLIQLIEQSPHFTRATFFAPTTQSPGDPRESFHIEARIKPFFGFDT